MSRMSLPNNKSCLRLAPFVLILYAPDSKHSNSICKMIVTIQCKLHGGSFGLVGKCELLIRINQVDHVLKLKLINTNDLAQIKDRIKLIVWWSLWGGSHFQVFFGIDEVTKDIITMSHSDILKTVTTMSKVKQRVNNTPCCNLYRFTQCHSKLNITSFATCNCCTNYLCTSECVVLVYWK